MESRADGRNDGEATRVLQRAVPPADAMAWVVSAGGASLAMHRVTVTFADGDSARLVLRRYVRPDQIAEDPVAAAHEAAVLQLVERIATPTPRLISVDPTGDLAARRPC